MKEHIKEQMKQNKCAYIDKFIDRVKSCEDMEHAYS